MNVLLQTEENLMGMTSFREVLEKMLVIVVLPVRKSLRKEVELFSPHLVSNTCGLLASIVSELTASALGSEVWDAHTACITTLFIFVPLTLSLSPYVFSLLFLSYGCRSRSKIKNTLAHPVPSYSM